MINFTELSVAWLVTDDYTYFDNKVLSVLISKHTSSFP